MSKTDVTINTFESKELIEYKLANAGFEHTSFTMCDDIYFTPYPAKEIKQIRYNDLINHSIIVRSVYEDIISLHKSYMVHKHKYFNKFNQVLSEELSVTSIKSATEIIYIFKTSGLNNWISLQQQKHFYTKGNIILSVSQVHGLDGYFLTIKEFPEIQNLPRPKKFKILCDLIDNLKITHTPDYSCKKSYMLYQQQRKRKK